MATTRLTRLLAASIAAVLISVSASFAQAPAPAQGQTFEPRVGQEGKDVIWVPTPQELVDRMLDMAKVTPKDFVMDLGSGDGRTVITAARRGATAEGIEYNPDMVALSQKNAAAAGVTAKASFRKADLFQTDLSRATVITMFLLPHINLKLRPTLLNLKPGTRVVSNTFTMDDWTPDETAMLEGDCTAWCTAHLWIVPAKVDGTWMLGGKRLTLNQQFQMLTGSIREGSTDTMIKGKVLGDTVTFSAAGVEYKGKVNGRRMQGTMASGAAWTATRPVAAAAAPAAAAPKGGSAAAPGR
ncbi:MAG: class I SAM-dependent methyltransferase [Vicinamibacterales bacterium]